MHETAFAVAARPARFSILGLLLKPYSIGHEIILLQKENALIFSNFDSCSESVKNLAISEAALICSQSWVENNNPPKWMGLWSFLNRKPDYKLAISRFKHYRAQSSMFPPLPDKEAEGIHAQMNREPQRRGRELGSPYLARLYNFLCTIPNSDIRIHGETIFDFPMSLANFLYLSHLESLGEAKIENRIEAEIKAEMKGHRESLAKQRAEESAKKEAEKCPH